MKEFSSSTRVKICGIRDKNHALAAVEAGADFIGLVFAPSKRQVSPAKACEIASAVKKSSDTTKVVGVFVNAPSSQVNELTDFCALDWVQLSGDESWEYCREVVKPVIKAIRTGQQSPEELYAALSAGSKLFPAYGFITLLDSQVEGKYGGTGESFNWNLAQRVAKRFPVIIAGGLNPKNVAKLIERVAPWGVDVSSGVETGGVKDMTKIKAFIEAVRKADERR
ncbi:MAG TPA: phosphoribosylanthranilate isomerase [Dehalococcoidia bacterium]|nr:phosphoribosylanthranilate isomerase [Dehalococcoidia bacterium]